MVGLHSSDPATVFLSARARVEGFEPEHLERDLYDRRSVVRMLGMRRTLFVVPIDLAGVIDEACTKALLPAQRRRLIAMLTEQAVTDEAEAWLDDVSRRTLAALGARGEASARELTADVPELATKLTFGEGKTWGGTVGVSTRVLFLLATAGLIVRARPLGRWTSGQYRWAPTDRWIEGGLPKVPHDEACAELLRRWLRAFGPATHDRRPMVDRLDRQIVGIDALRDRGGRGRLSTTARDGCCPTTSSRPRRHHRGSRCCRRSTRP